MTKFTEMRVETKVKTRVEISAVAKLRKDGKLKRIGPIKSGHWEVI